MTLQLENYGVSELSHSEQRETDGGKKGGGGGGFWAIVTLVISEFGDFKKGWQDADAGKPYNYQK